MSNDNERRTTPCHTESDGRSGGVTKNVPMAAKKPKDVKKKRKKKKQKKN